jgi:transcriptional regulator with XRE-family HTH domain
MQFFERIRERREKLNMSQEELAKRLGYKSRSSINKIEIGENDIPQSKIKAFADALQTTPAYLMGWKDDDSTTLNASSLPSLTVRDERSIKKKLEAVINDLMPANNALAYYDGDEPMSDEDKELLRISLENTMRLAKQMAKQKFTPKKFKK